MSQDIKENMPDEVIPQEQTEQNINDEPFDAEEAFAQTDGGEASVADDPITEDEPADTSEDIPAEDIDADGITEEETEAFPFLSDADGELFGEESPVDEPADTSEAPFEENGDACVSTEEEAQAPHADKANAHSHTPDPLICGYTKQQYEEAITELDEPEEDDLFINKKVTESQSTVIAVVKAVVYVAFIVSMSVMIAYLALSCANDMFAFVKDDDVIEVTIPEYATASDLSKILGDAGAIKHPWLFRLYAQIKGIDEDEKYTFVAGDYTISPNMNYDEMFLAFVKTPSTEIIRITIPEGYTVDDIIALFVSKGIGTKEGFIETINNYEFEGYDFINDIDMTNRYYRLEGYLYPDTYEFYMGKSEAYYIYKLLARFNQVMNDELRAFAKERGITIDEALTIASIIEKEAYFMNDYDLVSSVIWNRLESDKFPYIECDTTLLYSLTHLRGERVTDLTKEELNMDDPYNSYKNEDLPPSPICNPSFTAITCALYPQPSDYYFFVSDKEMVLHYAKTLAEHNKNIDMIKKQEAE
jgi:UPF0755 protein